jgi:Uma2 family endonuclease
VSTPKNILLTAEEFDNYPFEEDKRYELDEGEFIVTARPAYRHNRVTAILTGALFKFFAANPIGESLISENVYALSATTRRAPDVAVILGDHREQLANATVIPIIPDIAVEILSPKSPRAIHRKLKQYFAAGVKEVWIVDPESATAEIWTGPKLPEHELAASGALTSPLLPGFSLPLVELFS